ncbi:50S ribosomal protein L18 [Streptococcus pneumoniae]|nr:50S ribosomal protein L18 [Streptococcus pneumoniae]SPR74436.1 50S ribosomal protein L18 [Streptococcus pneumoniae]SPR78065.1 50S ribosomal protein L18 [Streptococcus pneumoniae]
MISKPDKNKLRQKRHRRVRGKLSGTADRPRLNVFRSNTGIYAQVIDDVAGVTLASASTLDKEVSKGTKTEQAVAVGKLVQNVQTLKVFQKWCSTAVDIYITDV